MITTTTLKGVLFSAYAEVFLKKKPDYIAIATFLCLRRGVSAGSGSGLRLPRFSLPTQRCFWKTLYPLQSQHLFSAYAEVFPDTLQSGFSALTFLCLRRGVSDLDDFVRQLVVLFSAYAEVFLDSGSGAAENAAFLCLRRGVSRRKRLLKSQRSFSLPTQRCFHPQMPADEFQ